MGREIVKADPNEWVATSVEGFVQRLVNGYVTKGSVFFIHGVYPRRISGDELVEKDIVMIKRYGANRSAKVKYTRRKAGLYNTQYFRYERNWLLVCTYGTRGNAGTHDFFEEHTIRDKKGHVTKRQYKDFREHAYTIHGVSVSYRFDGNRPKDELGRKAPPSRRRGSVRLSRDVYLTEKNFALEHSCKWHADQLERWFKTLCQNWPAHYAPIEVQVKNIFRAVQEERKKRGFELLDIECLNFRWRSYRFAA